MIRVLFISHAVEFAGAEIALIRFIALLDRTRFEPILLLPRAGDLHALIGDIPHVQVYYEPTLETEWDSPEILAQVAPICALMEAVRPGLIVVNTNTIPQAVMAGLLTDIPLMVHLHAFIINEQFEMLPKGTRFADELWLPLADHIIACSEWVADRYAPLLRRTIDVVPNTVLSAEPADYPSTGTPLIVMLASLEDNKRPHIFIEVAALLRRKYPRLRFQCRLYGEGTPEYTEILRQQIRRLRLGTVFTIHARTADTAAIYRASAAVFVPSAVEAFSMVAAEAAAHRRPVVATRCGGPESIIIDGETGYLVEVDDTGGAADRIAALLSNPALAAEMGKKARARFEREYAPPVVTAQYEAAIACAIAAAPENRMRRQWGRSIVRYFVEPSANADTAS